MKYFKIRIIVFCAFLVINIAVTLAGALVPIDYETAQTIADQIPKVEDITALLILQNNLSIALIGFVPILGVIWMLIVLYSTGIAISAILTVSSIPISSGAVLLLFILLNPIFWIEYAAYTLAMTAGTMLVYSVYKNYKDHSLEDKQYGHILTLSTYKKEILEEIKILLISIIIVVVLLVVGAVVEDILIKAV